MEQLSGGLPILLGDCLVQLLVELVCLELGLAEWFWEYRKETPSISLLTIRLLNTIMHIYPGNQTTWWSLDREEGSIPRAFI